MSGPTEVHRWGRFETAVEAPFYDALDPLRDVRATADFTSLRGPPLPPRLLGRGKHLALPLRPGRAGAVGVLPARRRAPGSPGHRGRTDRRQRGLPVRPLQRRQPLYRFGPPRMSAAGATWCTPERPGRAPLPGWTAWRTACRSSGWRTRSGTGPCWPRPRSGVTTCGCAGGRDSAPQFVSTHWRTAPEGGPAWLHRGRAPGAGAPGVLPPSGRPPGRAGGGGDGGGAGAAVGHRGRGGGRAQPRPHPLRGGLRPPGGVSGGPLAGPPGGLHPQRGRALHRGAPPAGSASGGRCSVRPTPARAPRWLCTPGASSGWGRVRPEPGWTSWATRAATAGTRPPGAGWSMGRRPGAGRRCPGRW